MVAVAWYNLLQLQPSTTSPEVVISLPHCHAKKLPIQVSFGVVNPSTWPFLHKNHMVLVVSYSDSFLPWFQTLVPLDCLIPQGLETSTPSMVVDGAWRFKGQHIRPFQHLFSGDGRTQSPQHGLLGKSERQKAEFAEFSELWSSTDKNQGQQRPSTCCHSVEVHNHQHLWRVDGSRLHQAYVYQLAIPWGDLQLLCWAYGCGVGECGWEQQKGAYMFKVCICVFFRFLSACSWSVLEEFAQSFWRAQGWNKEMPYHWLRWSMNEVATRGTSVVAMPSIEKHLNCLAYDLVQ